MDERLFRLEEIKDTYDFMDIEISRDYNVLRGLDIFRSYFSENELISR